MNKNKVLIIGLSILLWGMFSQFVMAQIYSDTTWERLYMEPLVSEKPRSSKHLETYDKGFLLGSYYYTEDGDYKPKLIKTDISGYFLWDRILDTINYPSISSMAEYSDGSVVIVGGIDGVSNRVPWVIKLDACFEVMWCKTFEWDEYSTAVDVCVDQNGDIVVLTSYYGHSPGERINLIKLSPDGELIWKKNYATIEDHPYIWNAQSRQLLISQDNHYYITGEAWWPTNNDPSQGSGLRPFFIKVNQWGEEKWVLPFGIYDGIYGDATNSFQFNDTLFLGLAYDWQSEPIETVFIWYSNNGEVYNFNSKEIQVEDHYFSQIHDPKLLNDNTLWGIMLYLMSSNETEAHVGYIQLDTSLSIINYLEDDRWEGSKRLIKTHNNKFLTVAAMQEDTPGFIYDVYISKRNEDYSFDTVYNNWSGSFDSLCPHQIESGYLPYNCETIIVGTEELESEPEIENKDLEIKVSPNPANKKVRIEFENLSYEQLEMQIFNISGEEEYAEILLYYPHAKELDISSLSRGVYMIALRNKGIIVGRAKLVVEF